MLVCSIASCCDGGLNVAARARQVYVNSPKYLMKTVAAVMMFGTRSISLHEKPHVEDQRSICLPQGSTYGRSTASEAAKTYSLALSRK